MNSLPPISQTHDLLKTSIRFSVIGFLVVLALQSCDGQRRNRMNDPQTSYLQVHEDAIKPESTVEIAI